MTVAIERIGGYIPETAVAVAGLRDYLGLTDIQVRKYTAFLGFVRVARVEGMSLLDMLLASARAALGDTQPSDVGHVVFAHTIQQASPPGVNLADEVRSALRLPHAMSFSLTQQNCLAGLYGVHLAEHLLAGAPPSAKVLIVMGERTFSPMVSYVPEIAVLGEVAAAVVVGRPQPPVATAGDLVLASRFRMDGRYYQGIKVERPLFAEYHRCYSGMLSAVIADAVAAAGHRLDDVAWVLPHNVSRLSWMGVSRLLGLPLSRFFLELGSVLGHTFCADPFLNLDAARRTGRVCPGDLVVLASVGFGAMFGALVLRVGPGNGPSGGGAGR